MSQENFSASNIKCGGCAANIENGLKTLAGVSDIKVDISSGNVTVSGENLDRASISQKLAELGYPEKGN